MLCTSLIILINVLSIINRLFFFVVYLSPVALSNFVTIYVGTIQKFMKQVLSKRNNSFFLNGESYRTF